MASGGGSESGGSRFARAGAGGVVPRTGLFRRLEAARVTVVSAPAGSGKTVLLRSWIAESGLEDRAARVTVGRGERDPQRFWLSVLDALRRTVLGSGLVRELTAAPDLDGWAIVERLLMDLAALEGRLWLVVDDVHELGMEQARRQLELLLMRAPSGLRFVLATRHDVRLGLHRLRLEGELAEIRGDDLRFSLGDARVMFEEAGVELPGSALALLHERTEGWAAGLRLAVLSLANQPDTERFADEFSGSERTVAQYLLAEVLERQSGQVRRLLLRTSVLERVSGELADALTGGSDGGRVLQELVEANAFVVALDVRRSWFRYHHLFADLLQLELLRTAPDQVTALHHAAADWLAGHGFAVEAIRHAQAAEDWDLAVRLLSDHWPSLQLGGQAATVHAILAGFPGQATAADAELAALVAADKLAQGSLEAADRFLELAKRSSGSVPTGRRGRVEMLIEVVRLLLARQRSDLRAVAEEAHRLQAMAEAPEAVQSGIGDELRALALISLGITEYWTARLEDAERHLEQGVALARRIGRPFLEFGGLAYLATVAVSRSVYAGAAVERSRQAIELAERHGWTDEPPAGLAYVVLAAGLAWQGRLDEAEDWILRAERTVKEEAEPAAGIGVHYIRGQLELARRRDVGALAAFRAAERLAERLAAPHLLVMRVRGFILRALVRLGETERAEHVLSGLSDQDRDRGEIRIAIAVLRLAQDDPRAAAAALAPVLDGAAPIALQTWVIEAFLLQAIAQEALGEPAAAGNAVEQALNLAESDHALSGFLLFPAPGLLERHARECAKHAALISEIVSLLAAEPSGDPEVALPRPREAPGETARLTQPLSQSEVRVLRYLPTHLSTSEIARELSVSVNTVRTHMRHLFAKLSVHRRTEAVTRARALGLLAPSAALPKT